MGANLYSLCATGRRAIRFYKSSSSFANFEKISVFVLKRNPFEYCSLATHKAAHEARAHKEYQGYAVIGKFRVGADVYKLNGDVEHWLDIHRVPGELIGRIAKNGKSFYILTPDLMPETDKVVNFFKSYAECKSGCLHYYDHPGVRPLTPKHHRVYNFDENNSYLSGYQIPVGQLDTTLVSIVNDGGEFLPEICDIGQMLVKFDRVMTGYPKSKKTVVIQAYRNLAITMYGHGG